MYIILLKKGGNTMFFNSIIYNLCDILLYFYSMYKKCNVDQSTYDFLLYHLMNKINNYSYKDDKIETIVVGFNQLGHDDLVLNNLDNNAIYCIKQYIATNLINTSDDGIYTYNGFHIFLNVCPFEGLTIDSDFIISVCDCMMY